MYARQVAHRLSEKHLGQGAAPPAGVRQLRACNKCGLLQTRNQWRRSRCPNCAIEMEDAEAVRHYTTSNFVGMVSIMDGSDSWAARALGLQGKVMGCYAVRHTSTEGDEYDEAIEEQMRYAEDDGMVAFGEDEDEDDDFIDDIDIDFEDEGAVGVASKKKAAKAKSNKSAKSKAAKQKKAAKEEEEDEDEDYDVDNDFDDIDDFNDFKEPAPRGRGKSMPMGGGRGKMVPMGGKGKTIMPIGDGDDEFDDLDDDHDL
ncbi:MAG: hypothetical protein MHM6MM_008036 [Cercozoa sp. M6MM]